MPHRDEIGRQVDRILASTVLHGSESLCRLLQYLAKHTLDHPGASLKEYQIATEVLGRPAHFDPQSDSTVRVQAGRLRSKLAEYYASEGVEDLLVIELPKGSYALALHERAAADPRLRAEPPAHSEPAQSAAATHSATSWLLPLVSTLLVIALGGIAWLIATRKPAQSALASDRPSPPAAFQTFWKSFLGPEEPWVIFSNADFVGRPESGMRYYNPVRDSREVIWDHYTGVGEVLAVHNLDQVFALLHYRVRVKRGSLFTLDDAQNNNLIFVGSPSENLTLRDIPNTQEFVFRRVTSGPRKGDLAVVDLHPLPGKQNEFLASRSTEPLTEDYAVVGLVPGLDPKRSVLILAGTTTFGTQAAVEYVCRENSVEQLLAKFPQSKTGVMHPFEALLRVKVARGVPVETELVAVKNRADVSSHR